MRLTGLREATAILLLSALLLGALAAGIAAAVLLHGVVGILAGVLATLATAQLLRRPVGAVVARLVAA